MAPLAKDDEAALSGTFTTDHRAGAPQALGKGTADDDVAADG